VNMEPMSDEDRLYTYMSMCVKIKLCVWCVVCVFGV
jgi:hypothetical protein